MTDVALLPATGTVHPARRDSRLLVCAVGAPGAGAVSRLAAARWTPERAAAVYCDLPADADAAIGVLDRELGATSAWGVLLIETCPTSREFLVEMRAQNRPARRASDRISPLGPAVARATGPVADMRLAVEREGLPVRASSDAGGRLGNDLLYRLLTEVAPMSGGPAIGLLHLPARDTAADTSLDDDQLDRGVMAAVRAFAETLCSPTFRTA